jgi:hypothetical protein
MCFIASSLLSRSPSFAKWRAVERWLRSYRFKDSQVPFYKPFLLYSPHLHVFVVEEPLPTELLARFFPSLPTFHHASLDTFFLPNLVSAVAPDLAFNLVNNLTFWPGSLAPAPLYLNHHVEEIERILNQHQLQNTAVPLLLNAIVGELFYKSFIAKSGGVSNFADFLLSSDTLGSNGIPNHLHVTSKILSILTNQGEINRCFKVKVFNSFLYKMIAYS